ncbi:hypothetical protein AAFC00_000308 [Neodothiora populina]|uniref:Methyltransferase domain-containing protein n=1 Tax=Neodothiora populina TaxID=2781224 RepID=A0ABR3PCG4_9PEZI
MDASLRTTNNANTAPSTSSGGPPSIASSSGVLGSGSGSGGHTGASPGAAAKDDLLANPFELRHGRRYLRDLPYPLPCDLAETQRQNMRTMLGMTVFGKACCAPIKPKATGTLKVVEIGCGAAYWSATCHDWLASVGITNVSFTGIDIAPLAPDLNKQGVKWRYIQHDLRRLPWPFEDEEFDLVMVKDMSLAVPIGIATQQFVDETIRIIAEGGILEFWESDHTLRCLRPHPPPPPGMLKPEEAAAISTKTYLISPGTPFAPAQNKYVINSNSWISDALDDRRLTSAPCARLLNMLYQEADTLTDIGVRRVAVPLGELRWEKDRSEETRKDARPDDDDDEKPRKGKGRASDDALTSISTLTPDQAALRYTALVSVLQKIESLEPILKDVSGKNSEEWSRWWASMMSSLLDQHNGSSGEVLEVGAWWAIKKRA